MLNFNWTLYDETVATNITLEVSADDIKHDYMDLMLDRNSPTSASSPFSEYMILDPYIGSKKDTKSLANQLDGKCMESIYVCLYDDTSWVWNGIDNLNLGGINSKNYAILINTGEAMYINDDFRFTAGLLNGEQKIYACKSFSLNEDKSNGNGKMQFSCDYYDEIKNNMISYYSKDMTKYYDEKSKLLTLCSSILQYGNYNDSCMNPCLNMSDDIHNLEKQNIINGSCNVSDRIIKWIANILKWIKYIAPVLVIILSILDFIKAIASQSDDEMKKTQEKFVKRLIAAALLFIIPFIIQFALEAFNLVSDYCNLI